MATLSLQSFTTMVQNMAASVQGAAYSLLDLTVGSVLRSILEAVAGLGLWLQYMVLLTLQQTRLATSTGDAVDSFVADFPSFGGRIAATAATGTVTFSRFSSTSSALIVVGALVRTSDGTVTFEVTTDTTNALYSSSEDGYIIPSGTTSATLPVECTTAGTTGNVSANTITLIVGAIPGVDTVNNANAFTNGEAAETDAAVKTRFQNFISTRALCTESAVDYSISALNTSYTSDIVEFENTAGVYTPGSFVVYFDDGTGSPTSSEIQTISTAVNDVRACGIQYAVQGPTLISANIAYTLTVASGATKSAVIATVNTALAAFINAIPMGGALSYLRLAQVIFGASASINDVTDLTLNGGTADIGGSSQQVVRAGTLTGS